MILQARMQRSWQGGRGPGAGERKRRLDVLTRRIISERCGRIPDFWRNEVFTVAKGAPIRVAVALISPEYAHLKKW